MSQIIRSKSDLKNVISILKVANKSIGLVPTMGALHQGHLSLVKMSKSQYDITVATIFINPTQFNNKKDLKSYPKTEALDIEMLRSIGCDFIFIPEAKEIYNGELLLQLNFGYLENILEGKHRPRHFNGVGLVVMKLFGLVQPTGAYFGQKDIQQFIIISALVNDFDLPIKLHLAPIIREKSGLAMSSRNKRLSESDKEKAAAIFAILKDAKNQLIGGVKIKEVLKYAVNYLGSKKGITLEYFEIVEAKTLKEILTVNAGDRIVLCAAVFVAGVRLIDNIIIEL